jgi:nucleoside 2-deoxyribosyltransferase
LPTCSSQTANFTEGRLRVTTVYLAGPINGCTDDEAHGWRQSFVNSLPDLQFLDPMVRDYRGREDESVAEIVEGDKSNIEACDVFLAYCWQVSWGTAMEIFYAHALGKRVVLVVPEDARVSPWLRYHADAIVSTFVDAAHQIGRPVRRPVTCF